MTLWIVPGAPLPQGGGWRVWCSRDDGVALAEPLVTVSRGGANEAITTSFTPIPVGPNPDRASAVLEIQLTHPNPGALYEVSIPRGTTPPLRWRSFPDQLTTASPDGQGALTLLLSSCFYQPNDAEGTYAAGLRELCEQESVNVKVLVGDQLYADWPMWWVAPPPSDLYAERYEQYWSDDVLRAALALTPNAFVCDDHEFWNDYPHAQLQVPYTWTSKGRKDYGKAALAALKHYQLAGNPDGRSFFSWDIDGSPPLSIFFADERTKRDPVSKNPHHFFKPAQWTAFEHWATSLQGPGVLVIGEPLLQPTSWREQHIASYTADYERLWGGLAAALNNGHDVLILTGDIHFGRYAFTTGPSGNTVHELTASPAANIASGPFVGRPEDALAPAKITVSSGAAQGVWRVTTVQADRMPTNDNNVAVLRFSAGTNARVRCDVAVWQVRPVDDEDTGPLLQRLYTTELDLA